MRQYYILLTVLLLLAVAGLVSGRGVWGKKKPREEDEEGGGGVGEMAFGGRRGRPAPPSSRLDAPSSLLDGLGGGSSAAMEEMVETYIQMMEELVESPDFDSLVTVDSLKQIFASVPGAGAEIGALLDGPQFSDPAMLRATVKEGIRSIRLYAKQMIELFSDPAKIDEMMDQLPAETKDALKAIMGGDTSQLQKMMANIPGLDAKQQELLSGLFDGAGKGGKGAGAAVADAAEKLLSDASQLEAARQQFLADPSMAQMLGVPEDVLHDPKKWAALMAEGVEQLKTINTSGEADGDIEDNIAPDFDIGRMGARRAS